MAVPPARAIISPSRCPPAGCPTILPRLSASSPAWRPISAGVASWDVTEAVLNAWLHDSLLGQGLGAGLHFGQAMHHLEVNGGQAHARVRPDPNHPAQFLQRNRI